MYVYERRGLATRLIYLAVAIVWWLATAGGRLSRTCVVTLCYHGVTTAQKKRFAHQMALISSRAIACDQICLHRKSFACQPAVCITFDDAFANLLDNALPLSCKLGIPVTVFAVTQNMGSVPQWQINSNHPDSREVTMTQEQVKRASHMPLCSIASHSSSHPRLTDLTNDAAEHEFIQSREDLEKFLDKSVHDFAFPHGACNKKLIRAAFDCGYRRVYTLSSKAVEPSQDQRVISRMKMTPDVWPIEFRLTVTGAYEWIYLLRHFRKMFLQRQIDIPTAPAFEPQVPRT